MTRQSSFRTKWCKGQAQDCAAAREHGMGSFWVILGRNPKLLGKPWMILGIPKTKAFESFYWKGLGFGLPKVFFWGQHPPASNPIRRRWIFIQTPWCLATTSGDLSQNMALGIEHSITHIVCMIYIVYTYLVIFGALGGVYGNSVDRLHTWSGQLSFDSSGFIPLGLHSTPSSGHPRNEIGKQVALKSALLGKHSPFKVAGDSI